MSSIFGVAFRKIFNLIHNTKKLEKNQNCGDVDFQLQLLRSSSQCLNVKFVDKKDSGSSQEPLITPKDSKGSNNSCIDALLNSEKIQNTEILGDVVVLSKD